MKRMIRKAASAALSALLLLSLFTVGPMATQAKAEGPEVMPLVVAFTSESGTPVEHVDTTCEGTFGENACECDYMWVIDGGVAYYELEITASAPVTVTQNNKFNDSEKSVMVKILDGSEVIVSGIDTGERDDDALYGSFTVQVADATAVFENCTFSCGAASTYYQGSKMLSYYVGNKNGSSPSITLKNTSFIGVQDEVALRLDVSYERSPVSLDGMESNIPISLSDCIVDMTISNNNSIKISSDVKIEQSEQNVHLSALRIESNATLTICENSTGVLNVESTGTTAIGGDTGYYSSSGSAAAVCGMGQLIIKGGQINAKSNYGDNAEVGGHGIGTGWNTAYKSFYEEGEIAALTITGGTVDAYSDRYTRIGHIFLEKDISDDEAESLLNAIATAVCNEWGLPEFGSPDFEEYLKNEDNESALVAEVFRRYAAMLYSFVITGGSVKASGVISDSDSDEDYEDRDPKELVGKLAVRPSNGNGEGYNSDPLYLVVLTMTDGSNKAVTALSFDPGYTYGYTGMYTDSSGKLYLWLPESLEGAKGSITVGGKSFDFTLPDDLTGDDTEPTMQYASDSYIPNPSTGVDVPSIGGSSTGSGETIQVDATIDKSTGEVNVKLTDEVTDTLIGLALEKTEEAVSQGQDAKPIVTLELSEVEGAKSATVPAAALDALIEADVSLAVSLPGATITLEAETLETLADLAEPGDTLRVEASEVSESSLTPAQREQLGADKKDYIVLNIDVYLGEKKVDVEATISIVYTLKPGEDPSRVSVWYFDKNGFLTNMEGVYDEETGTITFTVNHQSHYVVGLAGAWPFTDVGEGDWYYSAVKYVYENGLMLGTSDTTFSPKTPLNRGMVATILWRIEGEPAASGTNPFNDLTQDWYKAAVTWAAGKDIVRGYGNGSFGPEDPVTREQLAAMLRRYSEFKGIDTSARADLSKYSDASSVSDWALEDVRWANAMGLITGRSSTILAPGEAATRAETAAILQRLTQL